MNDNEQRIAEIRARVEYDYLGVPLAAAREDVPYLLAALAEKTATIQRLRDLWDERTSQGLRFLAQSSDVPILRAALDGQEGR